MSQALYTAQVKLILREDPNYIEASKFASLHNTNKNSKAYYELDPSHEGMFY